MAVMDAALKWMDNCTSGWTISIVILWSLHWKFGRVNKAYGNRQDECVMIRLKIKYYILCKINIVFLVCLEAKIKFVTQQIKYYKIFIYLF